MRYLLILVFYLYRIFWTARPEKNPGLIEQQPWMTRLVHFLGPLLLDKTYSVKLYFFRICSSTTCLERRSASPGPKESTTFSSFEVRWGVHFPRIDTEPGMHMLFFSLKGKV